MNSGLRRRADRIVETRRRAVDLAQAELASLTQRTREATAVADGARALLLERLSARSPSECSSHDMSLEYGYVSMLAKQASRLAQEARDALAREQGARLKVRKAMTEHRKVEIWRDRLVDAARKSQARLEQLQSDELAARLSRSS